MQNEKKDKKVEKKGFFKTLVDKIDKKMEEKSKQKPCCGSKETSGEENSGSCCK